MKLRQTKEYLLLIDEEAEIKEGNLSIIPSYSGIVIVGEIDDMPYSSIHRNWIGLDCDTCFDVEQISNFSKIIAYHPLTKEAKELDLPKLPNPFKEKIDIYQLAIDDFNSEPLNPEPQRGGYILGFGKGYKAAQSKQFSLEDMMRAIDFGKDLYRDILNNKILTGNEVALAQDNFIQSLSTQQLPKEFIPNYIMVYEDSLESDEFIPRPAGRILEIRTNSEGKQELRGEYKY